MTTTTRARSRREGNDDDGGDDHTLFFVVARPGVFKARRLSFVKSSDIINFFSFFLPVFSLGSTQKKKEFEMKCLLVQKRVRLLLLLAASTTVFLTTPKKVESKCLDKCQFIPSVEWREQCNTCLEIPCRRCAPFSFFVRNISLSMYFVCV